MMRLASASLLALLSVVPLGACSASSSATFGGDDGRPGIPATGSGGERRYAVSGFDKVALAASGDVEVRTGQAFGVSVTGASADLDRLKVTQDGRTLGLGQKSGHWGSMGRIHWVVTMPRIAGAAIGGSGSIVIDRVDGGGFDGDIGGSGNLTVRGMRVDKATFSIGGSGNVDANGTARALSLSVGGSGKLRAGGLVAQTADVSIAGAGDVVATVRNHADVSIVGSGDVTITGGAKCSVTKMGSGTVRCG